MPMILRETSTRRTSNRLPLKPAARCSAGVASVSRKGCQLRVKQRVMAGGHNIGTDIIRRRHALGLKYLTSYWTICDEGIVFDARTRSPFEILRKDERGTRIVDTAGWSLLAARIEASGGVPPKTD